ncbi:hypothetical protein ACOSQ4_007358 [Xanthoceras sorbifolium]
MQHIHDSDQKPVALIVGVIGMAGLSLAEALKIYGSARRSKPTWFPSSSVALDHYITFDAADTREKLSPISGEVTHVFKVAIQVREAEEDNVKINEAMLGTQHYMRLYDQAHSAQLVAHDPPFHLVASHAPSLSYSVHRSSIIVGASPGSVYNALLTLAVYAIICRHECSPFRSLGTRYTWDHFCDMSDARVLAQQHIWAAVTAQCKNQAFNCTNGDVFTWKSLWQVLCDIFDLEFLPFDENDEFDFVGMMKNKGKVWVDIVEKYGLHKTKLEEITCFEALNNVLHFGFQHVSSMNKSREFGFFGYSDTLKSIGM